MSGFKAVGTRVYAESGSLVRRFDATARELTAPPDAWMGEMHGRLRKARRFADALNGVGPRAEHARRKAGI